jgi:threonine dehydrogenase-like Zn-dependent dehydrogenase
VDHPEPCLESPTGVKLRILEVGVCGTDKELCEFRFGSAPPGYDYFVLGHECLAQVVETGPEVTRLQPGELVVPGVRLPCPDAGCTPCRAGRADFCATMHYREHGIQDCHGFMTELVVEEECYLYPIPAGLRNAGVLIEPLTIVEKPLAEYEAIRGRMPWEGGRRRALVLGAGPVGLLGAMALIEAGFETWIYSRSRAPSPKSEIAGAIGAGYVSSEEEAPERFMRRLGAIDLVYEAAGAPQMVFDLLPRLPANTVFVFTGVPGDPVNLNVPRLVLNLVIRNQVVLGTVNAGPDDFQAACRNLSVFARRWPKALESIITARYPIEAFHDPVTGAAGGIKNVIAMA